MPIDRAGILRNAEKLIRQGKIDAAIAEYVRIVEDQPGDWNASNTLGDLYARAGQVGKAVEQFVRIADSLGEGGENAKAAAVYKKILKLKPDHEQTLLQLAEILAIQRSYGDARTHLNTVLEMKRAKGDTRGVLQLRVRIGTIDPDDYAARLQSVAARKEMGDVGGAHRDLKEIADELAEKGRSEEAIQALQEAATLNPDDDEIRHKLHDIYFAAGDLMRARESATSVEQLRMIAAAFQSQDNADESLATLRHAASRHPDDRELRADIGKELLAKGDLPGAAEYLSAETAGDDPALLLTVAEMRMRSGQVDEGLDIVRRLLEEDPSRREQIAQLGWTVAEQSPEAGHRTVELAADAALKGGDWAAAAAALQEFVTRVPNHIPTLMRLVEICVDGGLEATMYSAQAQLADAYIATGAANEARFIAEDLVAREPWEKANVERFRKTLVMLGEPDPDAIIAERLSGESPFMTTDLSGEAAEAAAIEEARILAAAVAAEDGPPPDEPEVSDEPPVPAPGEIIVATDESADPDIPRTRGRGEESHHFQLSANAIDLASILGEIEPPPPPPQPPMAHAANEDVEVDLSIVLGDIKPPEPPAPTAEGPSAAGDLEGVFQSLRDDAQRRSGFDEAEKEYKRALALRQAGDIDGCIESLEKASRAPKLRFSTSWMIARLYRDRELMPKAVEWLERAAQAPAPTADDGHQLLYELADGLERVGESARALAVLLELQAEASDYRDVAARVDRLTKVQAGG